MSAESFGCPLRPVPGWGAGKAGLEEAAGRRGDVESDGTPGWFIVAFGLNVTVLCGLGGAARVGVGGGRSGVCSVEAIVPATSR